MDTIKKIKTSESSIPRLEEIKNKIFDANQDNKMWQTITSFLIGFNIGSTDFTRFAKFVIFKDNYQDPSFPSFYKGRKKRWVDFKDNYKTMYNWTLIRKNYYEIFITFMQKLKNFYDTMKKKKHVFFGEILTNNKKKGTMIYAPSNPWHNDCIVYIGEIIDGKRHGKGKMTYLDGSVYNGEWKNGSPHGYGEFFSKGMKTRYVGGWKNGVRSGQGTEYYTLESFLNGFWKGGKKYVGGWNGKKHGKGIFTWNDGREFVGNWNNGKKSYTECKMTYSNGDIFVGRLKNYKREGRGKMTYSNGSVYNGEWKNDKKNGEGVFTYTDGRVYNGEWINNNTV